MALSRVFGIEGGLVFEHGTGDSDKPVSDGSQGTGMAVAAGTEGGVFGTAGWVALHGDARPVVNGVAQAVVRGEAADNDHALARAPGDRGGAAQAAQGMVVPAPQRIEGFCEQRGEDDPADSGKGGQDRHVVLPIYPRLVLLVLHGSSQGLGHAVHLLVSLGQLPAHESEPLGDASDVSDGGLGGSRRDRDRGLAQPAEHLSGVNTSHAMALQQAGDSFLADAPGQPEGACQRPGNTECMGEQVQGA